MIFLIEYDRRKGLLVDIQSFSDVERRRAQTARLETEIRLNREKIDHEVVILEAPSEQALRETHRRYFDFGKAVQRLTSLR